MNNDEKKNLKKMEKMSNDKRQIKIFTWKCRSCKKTIKMTINEYIILIKIKEIISNYRKNIDVSPLPYELPLLKILDKTIDCCNKPDYMGILFKGEEKNE